MAAPARRATAHSRELRESRGEILIGEVIAAVAQAGHPVVSIASDVDYQRVRFLALHDPVLYSIGVNIERIAASSETAWLTIQAEVRNYLASPEEYLQRGNELRRLLQSAQKGDVTLSQDHNSIVATTRKAISLTGLLAIGEQGKGTRQALAQTLAESIAALREILIPYRKTKGAETPP